MTPPAVHVGLIPATTLLAAPRHLQPVSGDHRSGHSLPTMSRHYPLARATHALICANQTLRPGACVSSLRPSRVGTQGTSALSPSGSASSRPRHLRSPTPLLQPQPSPALASSITTIITTICLTPLPLPLPQRSRAQSLSKLTSRSLSMMLDGLTAPAVRRHQYGPYIASDPTTHYRIVCSTRLR